MVVLHTDYTITKQVWIVPLSLIVMLLQDLQVREVLHQELQETTMVLLQIIQHIQVPILI